MNITAKQAQETEIFYIDSTYKRGELIDFKIDSDNLYNFVMRSAEETTSPVGVMGKLHIRHEDYSCRYGLLNSVKNDESKYEVWKWESNSKGTFYEEFETEEEADDYVFDMVYNYDFAKDDQRNTCYYDSEQEAIEALIECIAENWRIGIESAKSYYRRSQIVANERQNRIIAANAKRLAEKREYEVKRESGVKEEVSKLIPFCSQFKQQYAAACELTGMEKNNACASIMKQIIEVSGIGKVHYFWEDFRCLTKFLK